MLLFKIAGKRVEPRLPELSVVCDPFCGVAQRLRRQCAGDDAPRLVSFEQPRVLQDAQMLHEAGQRHVKRLREITHRLTAVREPRQDTPARRVGERGKYAVESGI